MSEIRAIIRAASLFGHPAGPRDESPDLLRIVSNLDPMVVHDDGTFQNAGVLLDEIDELGDGHRIEIDVAVLDDLASGGDDVIASVLALGKDFLEIGDRQGARKNIFGFVRDVLVIEPLLDLTAGRTTW